jgi:hypothetical protein
MRRIAIIRMLFAVLLACVAAGAAAVSADADGVRVDLHNQSGRTLAVGEGVVAKPLTERLARVEKRFDLSPGESRIASLGKHQLFLGLSHCGDFDFTQSYPTPTVHWATLGELRTGIFGHGSPWHQEGGHYFKTVNQPFHLSWRGHEYDMERTPDQGRDTNFDMVVKACGG